MQGEGGSPRPAYLHVPIPSILWVCTAMRIFALLFLLAAGCSMPSVESTGAVQTMSDEVAEDTLSIPNVKTGAAVLAEEAFERFEGKRIGLIVNHTARVGAHHLIDLVHQSPNVDLVALFGPEHGLRGTADAGEKISHGRDQKTGVPTYSLYGDIRKPTPDMLRGVDMLVFDVQDVGARFYTYISTMGLSMQAAADAGIPFVVLDRPNPLGGTLVAGWILDPAFTSFVGQYPIPVVHGLTVGELARVIQGERLLEGLETLELEVIPVEGWKREMHWPDTGLPWISPSPNIPDFDAALVFPGTCFFEATSASEGRGTREPFKIVGAPWANGEALARTLNAYELDGVTFEPVTFTPESIEGMASNPKLEGLTLQGVRLTVSDPAAFEPVKTGIYVLHAFYQQAEKAGVRDFINRPDFLHKLSGTTKLYDMLTASADPEAIAETWRRDVDAFRHQREPYLLYE